MDHVLHQAGSRICATAVIKFFVWFSVLTGPAECFDSGCGLLQEQCVWKGEMDEVGEG